MVDLTQSPTAIVLQLINDTNNTAFTAAQVTLGTPAVNDQVINTQNTIITLSSKINPATDVPVDLTYNRLNLKSVLEVPYCQIPASTPSRIADLLPILNAKYFINLTTMDIVDAPYRPADVATGIKKVTFSCLPTSLVYTGTVTVYLGDPDLIFDWFSRQHYQYASDFKTLTFQGNSYTIKGKNVVIDSQAIVPGSNVVAAYLTVDRKVRSSNAYFSQGQLLAHFEKGVLKEIIGRNGQSSYDAQGVLKPVMPPMPTFLTSIPENLRLNPQIVNNHLVYGTTFDVAYKKAGSGQTYYVDGKTGSDNNVGTSAGNAFKTFSKALDASPRARIIYVAGYSDYFYDMTSGWVSSVTDRNLDVIGTGSVNPIFTGTFIPSTWTNQIATVWYTSAPSFGAVVDLLNTDPTTGYSRLTQVTDIGTCQTTNSSYFYDTTAMRLYVNTFNGRQPDNSVLLISRNAIGSVTDAATVYMENLSFALTYTGVTADMTIPNVQGYLYTKNCQFGWTALNAAFNSYGFNVIHQNVVAQFGYAGGLSYNSDRVLPSMKTAPWVLEFNASVSNCGFNGLGKSPASAGTSYVTVVRINGVYSQCDGNMVQDSGEQTYSLNIGCYSSAIKWANADAAHYTAGVNSLAAATAYYYSCKQDDLSISFYPKGVAKVYLHDTLVGNKPCYQRETPYLFAYSE